jgi:hypothetical protein
MGAGGEGGLALTEQASTEHTITIPEMALLNGINIVILSG